MWVLWCPIEDSPQATTTSALLPFRRHRTSSLRCLSLSSQQYPIVSIDPSSISNPKLHAAARPEVMRFYESQSGLRALDLLRSAFLFMFQRQWLPHSTSKVSRSNNVTASIQKLALKESVSVITVLHKTVLKP